MVNRGSASLTLRLATPHDRPLLAALLARTTRRHGNLATEEQLALLGNRLSALATDGGEAVGFLGLSLRRPTPQPVERWGDVRLVAIARERSASNTLPALLDAALPALHTQAATGLVCLAADDWLIDALSTAGFVQVDQVISYVRSGFQPPPLTPQPAALRLAGPADAETVLALNAAAFAPFWRLDDDTLLSWLLTADRAVLALADGRPAGFALTADRGSEGPAHLIRIAIHPAAQGRGIGRQMVADAIAHAHDIGATGLALNTQASNSASRRVYESLGFQATGAALAVLMYPLDPYFAGALNSSPGRM